MATLLSALGIIIFFISISILLIGDDKKAYIFGGIVFIISIIFMVMGIIKLNNTPQIYEVKSAQTFYGSTEKINRVWLKDSDGSYFWIEIPDCDKPRFCEGSYIELSHNDFKNWIVSKDLD